MTLAVSSFLVNQADLEEAYHTLLLPNILEERLEREVGVQEEMVDEVEVYVVFEV